MKSIVEYIKENEMQTNINFVDAFIYCNNKFLILKRAKYVKYFANKWCLPGGHIDNGETVESAINREVKEETGINIGTQMMRSFTYIYKSGKSSCIFLVNLKDFPDVKINKESSEYAWITKEEFNKEYKYNFIGEGNKIIEKIYKDYVK